MTPVAIRENEEQTRYGACRLTDGDFERLGRFIYDHCGIKMPPSKKTMLESRLQRRVRDLGMESFSRYCDYLFSVAGQDGETVTMIDLVTTNKTDFFREADHFTFLAERMLPRWWETHGGQDRPLRVWSAGCSTGEEPYTLAMVLQQFAERCPGFDFRILATDISTRVLEKARLAVYGEERVRAVPEPLLRKYFLRSKDRDEKLVRIVPELRRRVLFERLNFMEAFSIRGEFDVIFCRNVIIYFDRSTQERLIGRFIEHLHADGHLFLGHSETLSGHDLPLKAVYPTVYRNSGPACPDEVQKAVSWR